jgi:hypothetical protein
MENEVTAGYFRRTRTEDGFRGSGTFIKPHQHAKYEFNINYKCTNFSTRQAASNVFCS